MSGSCRGSRRDSGTPARMDRLREHRTALISAAVTGQIDVREAAG